MSIFLLKQTLNEIDLRGMHNEFAPVTTATLEGIHFFNASAHSQRGSDSCDKHDYDCVG